uniref:Uncharacterized protein n=1 Tax=Opuntia streptacantha TaxID=393608 RepID=A0A7C9ER14_OPUST
MMLFLSTPTTQIHGIVQLVYKGSFHRLEVHAMLFICPLRRRRLLSIQVHARNLIFLHKISGIAASDGGILRASWTRHSQGSISKFQKETPNYRKKQTNMMKNLS